MSDYSKISTEQIKTDIEDTQNEIFDLKTRLEMTEKIQENRREGIRDRQEFIMKLNGILIEMGEYK